MPKKRLLKSIKNQSNNSKMQIITDNNTQIIKMLKLIKNYNKSKNIKNEYYKKMKRNICNYKRKVTEKVLI